MSRRASAALVVAVGGLDPGGGAGLVRDFLTARALGAQTLLVGSAWTMQAGSGVLGVEARSPNGLRRDVAAAVAAADGRRLAVKVGMIAQGGLAQALLAGLDGCDAPLVFDPVLAASSGGALFEGEIDRLDPLLARATVVTPNLAEAAILAGRPVATVADARAAAHLLLARGARAVLCKGGHLAGAADDLLVWSGGEQLFSSPRLPGRSPRGTGCALATAIAVKLAEGADLVTAVAEAKEWLRDRIAAASVIDDTGERHL